MARRPKGHIPIEASSGNIFADLGLPDAAKLDAKARLAMKINRMIAAQRLKQVMAAARLDGQPEISAIRNYRLEGFSVERLTSILLALELDDCCGI
jgi:predicted XRE-type DNA-binding protein